MVCALGQGATEAIWRARAVGGRERRPSTTLPPEAAQSDPVLSSAG